MFWLIVLAAFGGLGYYMYNLNKQEEIDTVQDWAEGQPQGQPRRVKIGRKWRAVNSSATLVEGAQGRREIVVEYIKAKLEAVEVPQIKVDERLVSYGGGVVWNMFSGERKMLVVQSKKFGGYYLLVNATDYGKQLNVTWYLMLRENWVTRLLRYMELHWGVALALFPVVILAKIFYTASRTTIPELMNMFESEELSCFCTSVHHAAQESVTALVHDLNLNSAKVNWQTRGFLSIA